MSWLWVIWTGVVSSDSTEYARSDNNDRTPLLLNVPFIPPLSCRMLYLLPKPMNAQVVQRFGQDNEQLSVALWQERQCCKSFYPSVECPPLSKSAFKPVSKRAMVSSKLLNLSRSSSTYCGFTSCFTGGANMLAKADSRRLRIPGTKGF